jgi:pimeloyl-ACP methyl ester carboxylesterase
MGWKGIAVSIAAALLVVALAGPFFIPVVAATGTLPVKQLAGPEAQFFEFGGVAIHHRHAGASGVPRILLHGFGASLFTFRDVFERWSSRAQTLAYDRPAFGLTDRPWPIDDLTHSPYTHGFNLDLLAAAIDITDDGPAVLIGNSAGGRLAVEFALAQPERVAALVLISPAVYTDGPPPLARFFSQLPQVDRLGPRILRWALPRFGQQGIDLAWHDPSLVTPEIRKGYALPLRADHWDVALWAFSQSRRSVSLQPRLHELRTTPILVVTGDDDRIVPTADSVRFAQEVAGQLVVVPECGHLAHEECPSAWDRELEAFLDRIPQSN